MRDVRRGARAAGWCHPVVISSFGCSLPCYRPASDSQDANSSESLTVFPQLLPPCLQSDTLAHAVLVR